jgi:hypothetical protein
MTRRRSVWLAVIGCGLLAQAAVRPAVAAEPAFHDAHFHLTNYIQEGTKLADYLRMMGTTVAATWWRPPPSARPWPCTTRFSRYGRR